MSSTYAMMRIVRWSLKDIASCFYSCRFPLDEEPEKFCSSLSRIPNGGVVINPKGSRRSHKVKRKMSKVEICHQEGASVQSSTRYSSTNSQENEEGNADLSWPGVAEEDYIVFFFHEDGGIHIINDGNSEESDEVQNANSTSSRRINRKLDYGEDIEESSVCRSKRDTVNKAEKDNHQTTEEDIAKPDEIKEINGVEEGIKTNSLESCDSNQSNSSMGSFAFPVLGWEWIGSPMQMPKSQGKHKSRNLLRQCCRF
ncbi:unnamed protein product [Fraxinus pennsylvanica]|uniref:Uncharacterized protein n=1 Tax=Fraxinus pennsylvanica TaxID=56036 RepID=A0AAD2AFB7_9LAMI|nr:unnamed protein product [Fraxinus pennsylvanica]